MQTCVMRRNRLQVFSEILHVCRSPTIKTRLMQKANLSYIVLQGCLQQLQELELLELHSDSLEYMTTAKGKTFLNTWVQLQELLVPQEKISFNARRHPSDLGRLGKRLPVVY